MTRPAFDIAAELIAGLEKAWNDGDGPAFAELFTDDVVFIDIRGVRHDGRETVSEGHTMILSTIYRDSHIAYTPTDATELCASAIVAHLTGTLECPTGPLAPIAHAIATLVLVRAEEGWRCSAFHNTRVMEQG